MLGLGIQLNINSNGGSFYRGGAAQLVADYQARVLAAGGVVENTTCLTKDLFYHFARWSSHPRNGRHSEKR